MNILRYPERNQWDDITARPVLDVSQLNATVAEVLAAVKAGGDKAVLSYEEKFDHVCLDSLVVSEEEFAEAENKIPSELADAIRLAHSNIATFHNAQKTRHEKIETAPGVVCWQKDVAIERVGLYIPGGTAPLFSTVLMLATPAKIAGCSEKAYDSLSISDARQMLLYTSDKDVLAYIEEVLCAVKCSLFLLPQPKRGGKKPPFFFCVHIMNFILSVCWQIGNCL